MTDWLSTPLRTTRSLNESWRERAEGCGFGLNQWPLWWGLKPLEIGHVPWPLSQSSIPDADLFSLLLWGAFIILPFMMLLKLLVDIAWPRMCCSLDFGWNIRHVLNYTFAKTVFEFALENFSGKVVVAHWELTSATLAMPVQSENTSWQLVNS